MVKSFSWVMDAGHPDAVHLEDAFRQLMQPSLSDRAVGVIGGALVEIYLTDALTKSLHPNALTETIFGPTGAIGNFGPKCDLAFLIGLVGAAAHRDLKTIVDIRNAFAHKLSVKDFKSDKTKDLASNLKMAETHTAESYVPAGTIRRVSKQASVGSKS